MVSLSSFAGAAITE